MTKILENKISDLIETRRWGENWKHGEGKKTSFHLAKDGPLTEQTLEDHIAGRRGVYVTGIVAERTMIAADVDCHHGVGDQAAADRARAAIQQKHPGAYVQTSTSGLGYHIYLILITPPGCDGQRINDALLAV